MKRTTKNRIEFAPVRIITNEQQLSTVILENAQLIMQCLDQYLDQEVMNDETSETEEIIYTIYKGIEDLSEK